MLSVRGPGRSPRGNPPAPLSQPTFAVNMLSLLPALCSEAKVIMGYPLNTGEHWEGEKPPWVNSAEEGENRQTSLPNHPNSTTLSSLCSTHK